MTRWVPRGPRVAVGEAIEIVAALRRGSGVAQSHVAEATHWSADEPLTTLVVDRAAWVEANVSSFQRVFAQADEAESVETHEIHRDAPSSESGASQAGLAGDSAEAGAEEPGEETKGESGSGPRRAVEEASFSPIDAIRQVADTCSAYLSASTLTGVLGLLSTRVLGQFDPFTAKPTLLLNAPTVWAISRDIDVDRVEFSTWVCLHEMVHRFQFANAPWLTNYLVERIGRTIADAPSLTHNIIERVRDRDDAPAPTSFGDFVVGPQNRETFAELTAAMSLIEGYADFMMDRTEAVVDVSRIRSRFNNRRESRGWGRVVKAVTGMADKMAQYKAGSTFCREVERKVGVDGLNAAFASPATLPSSEELAAPHLWVARVHG